MKAALLYPYQRRWVENPSRFTWLNASRQIGKSHGMTLRRIVRGIKRRRDQIFLSAGERQSRELMSKARTHVEAMKIAFEVREDSMVDPTEGVSYRTMEIVLPAVRNTSGKPMRIIGLPANPLTARGYTGDVLLDEFAMHRFDRAVYAAVYPSASRDNGEIDVCSTPMGRQNLFYAMREMEVFSHETVTILDATAEGCPQDPAMLRRGCPDEETWRQEYLCEFVDEATAFLTYDQITECEDETLTRALDLAALKAFTGHCVAGIDIARKKNLTVVWVFEVNDGVMRSRGMIEMRSTSFREQFEAMSSVLDCRCVRRVAVDASGLGMESSEHLVERYGDYTVERCTLGGPFKEQIANRMRNRFSDRRIRIPASTAIRNDLHSVRKTVTSAGNIRLDAPIQSDDGSHADRFWACALACHAAAEEVGPIEGIVGEPTKFSRQQWEELY